MAGPGALDLSSKLAASRLLKPHTPAGFIRRPGIGIYFRPVVTRSSD
jgi:hypothetical protein